MSILSKLSAVDNNAMRHPYHFNRTPTVSVSVDEIGIAVDAGIATVYEFALTGKIEVIFGANKAQYHDALRNAEKLFLARLYGDLLPLVRECKRAIYAGDAEQALEALTRIDKEMGL